MTDKLKFLRPKIRVGVISIVIAAALTFVLSTAVRLNQYHIWKQTPDMYFVGTTPMMTTVDAFYWIRMARDYQNGRYHAGQTDPLRFFPTKAYDYPEKEPLLCFLLRLVSKLTSGDLYTAGIYLMPFLASLFVIPLIIYFYRAGYPALGITGGLITTFCQSYHVRTCLGRVDTDSLNLFFPFMTSLFLLFTMKSRFLNLYAALAGITMYIFNLWYPTEQFVEMYFAAFALCLFFNKVNKIDILGALLIFLFFSTPVGFANLFFKTPAGLSNAMLPPDSVKSLLLFYLATFAGSMTLYLSVYLTMIPYERVLAKRRDYILPIALFFLVFIPVILLKFTLSLSAAVVFVTAAGFYYRSKFKLSHSIVIVLTTLAAFSLERWSDVKTLSSHIFTTYMLPYLSAYVFPILSNYVFFGKHSFMGVEFGAQKTALTQVSELYKYPFMETMAMILQNPVLTVLGLIFFAVFAVLNIKKMIPLSPVLLLGIVAFSGSNRFAMYLAPFVGVGYGYFVSLILESSYLTFKIKKETLKMTILYASVFVFFLIIMKQTAFSLVPSPSIATPLYSSFKTIGRTLPEKSVLFTWWDYGYALEDITGFATYHDGGSQETIKTLFIAHALTTDSQVELYNIMSMLGKGGSTVTEEQIIKNLGLKKVLDDVKYDKSYILYTVDMIMKLPAILTLRGIDAVTGEAESSQPYFMPINCQSIRDRVFTCDNSKIDLKSGTIDGRRILNRSVVVEDGQVLNSIEYGNSKGLFFEALAKNGNIFAIFLFNDEVFNSNFNQMYLLGNYDKDLFTEIYNSWPTARVFKVKTPVAK
ncbi:hypothetical protein [Candidatus Magnetomonas plexicatena]|uniref:hypothetical protein n=1 Tax=Candidatus Magnetomonas plexicatena TaxID=2552947 RepID=UPI0011025688|nr:hypothetical protein E2O03_001870 [Nitrospirales bacterium LBB_01]